MELQPCFQHSRSASYIVPFKPSGSFRVKAFFSRSAHLFVSHSWVLLLTVVIAHRIINDGPRVRRAEQEKLAQKSHDVLPLPPAHVPQLRAAPEVLEADASGITRHGGDAAEGLQSAKATLRPGVRLTPHQDPWWMQWSQNTVHTEELGRYTISVCTWKKCHVLDIMQKKAPIPSPHWSEIY